MVRVIDRNQRVDTCATCRLQLVALEFAFVGWEHAEADALEANRGLLQVNELHARNGLQELGCGFHDTGDAGMLVQGDPQCDAPDEVRFEVRELRPQEADEGYHLEGFGASLPLEHRQGRLGKLDLAARAPR